MRFLMGLFSLLLAGCSAPKVMIVEQGIAPETINSITADLQALGYRVERSTALVPESFTDTAIASNPSVTDPSILNPLKAVLESAGFDSPKHYQFAQGNHFYSAGHYGVYLRNPDVRLMPPIMGTRRCGDFSGTLEYFQDGRLLFEYEVQDENGSVVKEGQSQGRYSASGNTLILDFPPYNQMTLIIQQDKVDTHVGWRRADYVHLSLLPLLNREEQCRFDAVYE